MFVYFLYLLGAVALLAAFNILHRLGSIPSLPLAGCDFMPQLQQGLRSTLPGIAAWEVSSI